MNCANWDCRFPLFHSLSLDCFPLFQPLSLDLRVHKSQRKSFSYHALLALVYGGIMLYRRQSFKAKLSNHMMLAVADVLAKFLAIEAYQYTSITSIMLLESCWSTPAYMLVGRLCKMIRFDCDKLVGGAIYFAATVTLVFSDLHSTDRSSFMNPLKGDLLIIVGATLKQIRYWVHEVNFSEEDHDWVETLALYGISGAILTAPQMFIFERSEFNFILYSLETIFLFIGFGLAMVLHFSWKPLFLKINVPSRLFHLPIILILYDSFSLWPVLIQTFAYHEKVRYN